MKVESTAYGFRICVNTAFFGDINFEDKDDVQRRVSDFFKEMVRSYPIEFEGFYKICVYPSDVVVIFDVLLIDEYSYNEKDVDFRIVIYLNHDIYFRTLEFDILSECLNVYYDDKYLYVLVSDISKKVLSFVEFGDFVIDKDVNVRKLKKTF